MATKIDKQVKYWWNYWYQTSNMYKYVHWFVIAIVLVCIWYNITALSRWAVVLCLLVLANCVPCDAVVAVRRVMVVSVLWLVLWFAVVPSVVFLQNTFVEMFRLVLVLSSKSENSISHFSLRTLLGPFQVSMHLTEVSWLRSVLISVVHQISEVPLYLLSNLQHHVKMHTDSFPYKVAAWTVLQQHTVDGYRAIYLIHLWKMANSPLCMWTVKI